MDSGPSKSWRLREVLRLLRLILDIDDDGEYGTALR